MCVSCFVVLLPSPPPIFPGFDGRCGDRGVVQVLDKLDVFQSPCLDLMSEDQGF